jgi:hypothetical protein
VTLDLQLWRKYFGGKREGKPRKAKFPKSRSKLPLLDLDGHVAAIGGLREKTLQRKTGGEKPKLPKPEFPK